MKRPEIFLEHILECINEVERNTKDISKEHFFENVTIQDAVIRRLEIIGEAVKNLPKNFKSKYSAIPWKSVAGMRDILIHEYFGVDLKLIWKIVNKELPALKKQVVELLNDQKNYDGKLI